MKKILLVVAFMALTGAAYAQAGSLTIVNHNTNCGVYATMYAMAATEGDGLPCDIVSNQIYLCAAGGACSSLSWASPVAFHTSTGFSYETTFISIWGMTITTDFTWTDVAFQWDCPDPCSDAGGGMSETPVGTCLTQGTTWFGTLCTSGTSTWTSSTPGVAMSNITIDFN